MRTIKKAQNGAKTADSTSYFKGRAKDMARQSLYAEAKGDKKLSNVYMDVASKATSDAERQKLKGKPGYDKNGFPLKKKKAQNGATTTPKKTWQQMTAGEKGNKKKELVEKGGIQLFNKYKDSVGKQALGKIQGEFNKGATSMGMTPEQYSRYLDKQKKKPDTNTSSSDFKEKRYNVVCGKGGCKKNGGSIKKAKSGSKIPKAQGGRLLRKVADKIVSKQSNRIVDKVVKRPVGMTYKPVDYGKVVLTDAQKAKNAEILNRSKMTYVDKLRQQKIVQAEKATARNKAAFQAKLDAVKKRMGGVIKKAKDGMWMQKAAASIKKRGTAGKCTPITKPGCTGKAKALAKTFKKIAKSNKKK